MNFSYSYFVLDCANKSKINGIARILVWFGFGFLGVEKTSFRLQFKVPVCFNRTIKVQEPQTASHVSSSKERREMNASVHCLLSVLIVKWTQPSITWEDGLSEGFSGEGWPADVPGRLSRLRSSTWEDPA